MVRVPPGPTEEDVAQRQLLELLSDPATRARVEKAIRDQARAEGDEGEAAAEVLTALLSQHPAADGRTAGSAHQPSRPGPGSLSVERVADDGVRAVPPPSLLAQLHASVGAWHAGGTR